jgi:uncharacterized MAPEG superfamily protein
MTIAEWMIFAAVALFLLTIALPKGAALRSFDNANPRDPAFYAQGWRSRALAAHINGIETFPFFAVAVLLAEFRGAPQHWIDLLSVGFVVARLAYVAAYLGNWATARTLIWGVGLFLNAAIFFTPWWAR